MVCARSVFSKFIQTEGHNKAAKYWPQGRCSKKTVLCPWLSYGIPNRIRSELAMVRQLILNAGFKMLQSLWRGLSSEHTVCAYNRHLNVIRSLKFKHNPIWQDRITGDSYGQDKMRIQFRIYVMCRISTNNCSRSKFTSHLYLSHTTNLKNLQFSQKKNLFALRTKRYYKFQVHQVGAVCLFSQRSLV